MICTTVSSFVACVFCFLLCPHPKGNICARHKNNTVSKRQSPKIIHDDKITLSFIHHWNPNHLYLLLVIHLCFYFTHKRVFVNSFLFYQTLLKALFVFLYTWIRSATSFPIAILVSLVPIIRLSVHLWITRMVLPASIWWLRINSKTSGTPNIHLIV